jgi:hypothetical protein
VFTSDKVMLHLAVPPCDVSPGDSLDVARTQTVGELWPDPGAPPGEVPKHLALARTLEHRDEVWVGACELPGPVKELFTVDRPDLMLSVMNATRRTLGRGPMSISGDPSGRLAFTLVDGDITASASIEAQVGEAFTYWLDSGPATGLARPLESALRAVGSLGGLSDLMITNDQGDEARCFLDDAPATRAPLPADYFEHGADGLRIERQGGLGRDALAAIAKLRPWNVTLAVAGDASLVISRGSGDADAFMLDGPGFTTLGRSVPIVVPYVVALAMHDGAATGTVEISVDAEWGRLHRADQGVTVEWRR